MSLVPPLQPALAMHRLFMQEFLAAETPCFALGVVEERQRPCGVLARRVDEEMRTAIAVRMGRIEVRCAPGVRSP